MRRLAGRAPRESNISRWSGVRKWKARDGSSATAAIHCKQRRQRDL